MDIWIYTEFIIFSVCKIILQRIMSVTIALLAFGKDINYFSVWNLWIQLRGTQPEIGLHIYDKG